MNIFFWFSSKNRFFFNEICSSYGGVGAVSHEIRPNDVKNSPNTSYSNFPNLLFYRLFRFYYQLSRFFFQLLEFHFQLWHLRLFLLPTTPMYFQLCILIIKSNLLLPTLSHSYQLASLLNLTSRPKYSSTKKDSPSHELPNPSLPLHFIMQFHKLIELLRPLQS